METYRRSFSVSVEKVAFHTEWRQDSSADEPEYQLPVEVTWDGKEFLIVVGEGA